MEEKENGLKFEYGETEKGESAGIKIKVIGVGGCGCNIINDMSEIGVKDAELIAANTDLQSINRINANEKLQIGNKLTRGGGAGSDPEKGEKAAEEDRELIETKLRGTDMLFITCGLGGGTGSGAAPVIADIARGLDILTVGVVITPTRTELENPRKRRIVEDSMARLKEKVNSIITISNDKMFEVCDRQMTVPEAYKEVNKKMIEIINGIVTMISKTGLQNIDFEDVKATLKQKGDTYIGIGVASGTDRAKKAFDKALKNPFIGDMDLNGAKDMLINFVGNITLSELKEIDNIKKLTGREASVKYGIVCDGSAADEISVVVLISGIRHGENNEPIMPEKVEIATKMLGLGIKQMVEDNYANVDIPTFQRLPN
ncbi:MAG: cell division protein FtsZ [Spirochaetia bacterium]|nr:cell division protein FtsZ [Spirochaetia bacterium]